MPSKHEFTRRAALKHGALATTIAGVGIPAFSGNVAAGLGNGLVAHYQLNNLKGQGQDKDEVHDASPNENDGTAHGDVGVVDGRVGNAFSFDEDGDYVSVPHAETLDFERDDPLSISLWVNFSQIGQNDNEILVAKRKDTKGFSGYLLWKNKDDQIELQLQHSTDDRLRVATTSANLNNSDWFHIAGIYDGSVSANGMEIYINGLPQSVTTVEDTLSGSISNTDPLRIARQRDSLPLPFTGQLDDIYLFNRALGSSEVCQLVLRGLDDGERAHYPLETLADLDNDENVDDVEDVSSQENHGIWTDFEDDPDPSTSGQVGEAFVFDGDDDEVRVPDAPELRPGSSSWSVAFWANPENAVQESAVVSKRQTSSPYSMYLVGFANSAFGPPPADGKRFAFRYTEDARDIDRGVVTTNEVIDGDWHHFVAVADKPADELRLYVDGSEAPSTVDFDDGGWPDITTTQDMYLGQDNGGGRRYEGLLDEVRIFNRALSEGEIACLYDSQST